MTAFYSEFVEVSVSPIVLTFLVLFRHGTIGILEPDVSVDVGILGFETIQCAGSAERVPAVAGKWVPPWRAIGYRVRTAC